MTKKEELLQYVANMKKVQLRMTYKYFTQSYKVFHTGFFVREMEASIRQIAEQNNYEVSPTLQDLFDRNRGDDYFMANRETIASEWTQVAFEQLSVFNAVVTVLESILEEVDDDLELHDIFVGRTYFQKKGLPVWKPKKADRI
jgi:hypothetical protein